MERIELSKAAIVVVVVVDIWKKIYRMVERFERQSTLYVGKCKKRRKLSKKMRKATFTYVETMKEMKQRLHLLIEENKDDDEIYAFQLLSESTMEYIAIDIFEQRQQQSI